MATLMVHLELGYPNMNLLHVATDLAARLDADIVGIAACQPMQVIYADGYISGDLVEQNREELEKEIKDAEAEFRAALQKHSGNVAWRSAVTFAPLADYVADEARCAHLVITGAGPRETRFDSSRHINIGDLVMQLGRPALIVPAAAEKISFERMLIGWKETRESRRAVLDALPLLKKAKHVAVCEVASEEGIVAARSHVADVADWLKRDGVAAEPMAALATADETTRLNTIANDQAADVIVAGAYGHSRLREWAFGGVTRDLLLRATKCSFVSH